MFDTYDVLSKINVEHSGNILLRSQEHEWRESHCKNCKDGIITEKEFDENAAIRYMESIEELYNIPHGVSFQAHIHSAPFIAFKRGDKIDFFKEKSYKCVHHYCLDENSKSIYNKIDTI